MATKEFSGYSPVCLQDIQDRLVLVGASPTTKIGQHFLVNQEAVDFLAQTVDPGSLVVEVGCGVGHITERLAENASKLYGIEIDRRYRPLLDKVQSMHGNVDIIYGDALRINFDRLLQEDRKTEGQIVASLPYHITEPFIQKVSPLRLSSITLVVGRRYADSLTASFDSAGFGRLSILTSTFFEAETLATIQRDSFFPAPRTDSAIMQLRPRELREIGSNRRDVVFRTLFLSLRQNSTLRKGLKEGFDAFEQSRDGVGLSKRERNHKSRTGTKQRLREYLGSVGTGGGDFTGEDQKDSVSTTSNKSRVAIDKLNIPSSTLDKPFSLLNNSELRQLFEAL